MPRAGGTQIPVVTAAGLPNTLFLAPRSGGVLRRRPVDAQGAPTAPATAVSSAFNWSRVRGAFLIGGTVYYGRSSGGFHRRAFDAATGEVGARHRVALHGDPRSGKAIPFPLRKLTGMFYDTKLHRLYYTVQGDRRLFYRGFTPESRLVGAQQLVAARHRVSFRRVAGMTLAGRWLLYGSRDGTLRRVRFAGGKVKGRPHVVNRDGSWRGRAMFAAPGAE
jgi:hypothetical protein